MVMLLTFICTVLSLQHRVCKDVLQLVAIGQTAKVAEVWIEDTQCTFLFIFLLI